MILHPLIYLPNGHESHSLDGPEMRDKNLWVCQVFWALCLGPSWDLSPDYQWAAGLEVEYPEAESVVPVWATSATVGASAHYSIPTGLNQVLLNILYKLIAPLIFKYIYLKYNTCSHKTMNTHSWVSLHEIIMAMQWANKSRNNKLLKSQKLL